MLQNAGPSFSYDSFRVWVGGVKNRCLYYIAFSPECSVQGRCQELSLRFQYGIVNTSKDPGIELVRTVG